MTVQELIDELSKIQDKTRRVIVTSQATYPNQVWEDPTGEAKLIVIMTRSKE